LALHLGLIMKTYSYLIVKIKKHDLKPKFLDPQSVIRILKQEDDAFIVKLAYEDRHILHHTRYEFIEYLGLIRYFVYLKKNIALLVGILLFVSLLFVQSQSIKRIEFNAYTKDNERIESIIKEHIDTKLGFQFLDADLNELNFSLRKDFSHFEWIDVRKDGTILKVTVLEPSIINKQVEKIGGFGDLVASHSGFIQSYKVEHGVLMVTRNQYVQKGQLLVSGNLTVNREGWEPFYIRASGQVMAKVHHTQTVEVPKKIVENEYTGRVISNSSLQIFGLDLKYTFRDIKYEDYDAKETIKPLVLFNYELPFSLKKIHVYEKNDIIKIYDAKSAYDYALSKSVHEVSQNFDSTDRITETLLLSQKEEDDRYIYQFLIITDENIAEYKRSNVDE
jgi:similar to stage IV sporulation protein